MVPRSFDCAGSLNDLIILNLSSPLLESSADSSFLIKYEKSANIVPIQVVGESIQQLFALMNGIYPLYSRLVKGIQLLHVTGDSKKSHLLPGRKVVPERILSVPLECCRHAFK